MRHCPLCSSNDFSVVTELHFALFDDLDMSGKVQLAECNRCHFIFYNTEMKESDYTRYYAVNEYYSDAKTGGSGGYNDNDATRYARIFKQLIPYITRSKPVILDFGCGKGGMLKWLQENTDAQLIGVEASASCRSFVAEKLAVPVYATLSEVSEQVDIVILSHVLEHIFQPWALLEDLQSKSHPKTLYYVEVPRAEAYLHEEIKWRELYFEHINHFSASSCNNMMVDKGFAVLDKGRVPFYPGDERSPECLYFLAQVGAGKIDHTVFSCRNRGLDKLKPAEKAVSQVLQTTGSVSIWGISQYTQLVMGSYPELVGNLKFLFDSSPAKMDRTINGVTILPPQQLSLLKEGDILLMPDSVHTAEMKQYIRKNNYKFQQFTF